MAFETTPLGKYFGLREDRQSFSIDPWLDSRVYFGDEKLAEQIQKRLESDFVQPRGVPKFFVHGHYGSGKTHTLAHINELLNGPIFQEMYPTVPVYLDIAPLSSKEKYERIHARLLDAVGLDRIKTAVESVADRMQERDKVEGFFAERTVPFGDSALQASQANIYRNILFGGRQQQLSWEWLKGRKSTVDESQMLGLQKQLAEPQDFVNCLLNIGALHLAGTGKRLVYLIDEAESFGAVTNPDSLRELQHVLRLILENSNTYVGTIMAIQIEGGQDELPQFFTRDDIKRRVDYEQGYIDLNGLVSQIQDAETFIEQAIKYLVDTEIAEQIVMGENLSTSSTLFPFTEEAAKAIASHVAENPMRAVPAAIISCMSNAAVEAWRRRNQSETHQLVDESIVEETLFPEG